MGIPCLMVALHFSWTSGKVVGYNINFSSETYIYKLNRTRSTSSFDSLTSVANFRIFVIDAAYSRILIFGNASHACVMVASKFWLRMASSSFSFSAYAFSANICSLFIFTSLMANSTRYSLNLSSSDTSWCNSWRVWIGSATRLTPPWSVRVVCLLHLFVHIVSLLVRV